MNKEIISVYLKFRDSIFQDMNQRNHTFLMSEYDLTKGKEGMYFVNKNGEEEIFIPWSNIIVARAVTKTVSS